MRVFDTRDVEMAMGDYARLLEERGDVPVEGRMEVGELMDIMYEGRYTGGFEGK